MAQPNTSFTPTSGVQYTPLPRAHSHDAGFDDGSTHGSPALPLRDMQPDQSLPYGAAQPRFLGRAMHEDQGGYRPYSTSTFNTNNTDAHDSVYALNPDPLREQGFYGYRDNDSSYFAGSDQALPLSRVGQPRYLEEKRASYAPPREKSKRMWILLGALAVVVIVIVGVALGIVLRPKSNQSSGSGSSSNTSSPQSPGKTTAAISGGDGSKLLFEDGSTSTYKNSFGGYWVWDENNPFNSGARAQASTPALNETFKYGVDRIRGVNLGGWLTIEPFITPALFEKYLSNNPPPVDEWTLSQAMAADTASGGLKQLEDHYKTFITEQDFAEIAGAGLNYVRIPLPYWAIETRDGEPFLPKVAWQYFLKAIQWARKYGIRINLDLHALPGSQNGWNHSGRLGTVNVLNGPMGLANAQRSLDYIRIIAQFISQPQYKDVVTMFGITNEPQGPTVGKDALQRYYLQAYQTIRSVTGTGEGKGPLISFHDGFLGLSEWAGFLPNADRTALDLHPYLCFGPQKDADIASYATTPCDTWGAQMNTSMGAFGMTAAGEFSNAVTDCGLWLNGVNLGTRYDGTYVTEPSKKIGSCDKWTDWPNYDQAMKDGLKNFAMASMDALQNWFFWNWKIGNSSRSGKVETPAWSYKLGLDNGWMPKDPNQANGVCQGKSPWQPPLQSWQTGGAGAGQIPASVSAQLAWPPPSISGGGAATALPTYTPTGVVPTLPGPTFKHGPSVTATPSVGNGWANPADTAGAMVAVAGCKYLDPWVGSGAPPSPLCTSAKREAQLLPAPAITPPPQ